MFDIKISAAASKDLFNSSEWYDEQKAGLGREFQKEIFTTFSYIQKNPLLYSIRFSGKFHFAKTSRFPFLIVYEIFEDRIIINAIFHTSRDPDIF